MLVSAVFIIPFLLFPGYAVMTADVLSKRTVLVVTKILRGTRHGGGMRCIAERSTRLHVECLVLVGDPGDVSVQPGYGLLPEILPARDLARANGLIEMSTFVAIILGTTLGTASVRSLVQAT